MLNVISIDGQDRLDTHKLSKYVPPENNHVLIENLKPNFNYSCTILEYISRETEAPDIYATELVHFTTDYAGIYISNLLCHFPTGHNNEWIIYRS